MESDYVCLQLVAIEHRSQAGFLECGLKCRPGGVDRDCSVGRKELYLEACCSGSNSLLQRTSGIDVSVLV